MKKVDIFIKEKLHVIHLSIKLTLKYYDMFLGRVVKRNMKGRTAKSWLLMDLAKEY
jgi:hypothetical protein|tara:strand:+ start:689 stop:856 length:168 start_codon:yes stop_codon:yes gene_type:complete